MVCIRPIDSPSFHVDSKCNNKPVCEPCFSTKCLPQCQECGMPIRGQYSVYKGAKLHRVCMICMYVCMHAFMYVGMYHTYV